MTYSFCESVHASSRSKWHIRRLTEKGPKYGGGIDTKSLCGAVSAGWDLRVPIEDRVAGVLARDNSVCFQCLEEYRSQK